METSYFSTNQRTNRRSALIMLAFAAVVTFAVWWLVLDYSSQTNLASNDEVKQAYAQWKDTFGVKYGGAEDAFRLGVFTDSYNLVKAQNNSLLGRPYTLGLNQFAALTQEEFSSIYLGYLGNKKKTTAHRVFTASNVNVDDLPESIDWSAPNDGANITYVTPVKNQGSCGSCWAFSTTGAVESRIAIANKRNAVSLSEQQLVDCSSKYGNEGCNGGLMDNAFKYVEEVGLISEDDYPYIGIDDECQESAHYTATRQKIKSFSDVNPRDVNALKAAVAQGPVSVAIEADTKIFQLYKSGVLTDTSCGTALDHGVLVVGYGTDPEGGDYWKIKNSWGTSWGADGYILIARTAGDGECGVQDEPSFPVA